jgi:hypothetical protein
MCERESLSEALRDRKKHAANQFCMKEVEANQAREEIGKLQNGNKALNRKIELIFKQLHSSTEDHGEAIAIHNVALLFAATRQQQSFVSHQAIQHWYHVHAFESQTARLLSSQESLKAAQQKWNKRILLSISTRRISMCLHEALNHLEHAARLGSLLFNHSSGSIKLATVAPVTNEDAVHQVVPKASVAQLAANPGNAVISMDEVVAGVFDFPASPDQPTQSGSLQQCNLQDKTTVSDTKPADEKSQSDTASCIGPFGRRRLGVRDTKARVARITGVVNSLTSGLDFVQHR